MNDKLCQALYGEVMFRLLVVGIKTGIFEHLALVGKGLYLEEIYNEFNEFESGRLLRFLNACVAAELLKYDDYGKFGVDSQCKEFYISNSAKYIGMFIEHMDTQTRNYLNDLEKCIKGSILGGKIFDSMYKDERSIRKFLDAMWELGYANACEILQNESFPQYRRLADIGGGAGVFSIVSILEGKAESAVVFDLKSIKFYVDEKISDYQMVSKLKFVGGDFFKDELPIADAYVLGYVLSDWEDDVCKKLLKRIHDRAPKHAEIIILERLFNANKVEPFNTAMMDVCMMVETGGKHRTYEEYISLMEECGFHSVCLITSESEKHAIVGKKV